MLFFSSQSPGQYYFKPMMKEFRFEPASQMITVEEGQNLSIDITGIKTAYRYLYTLICIYLLIDPVCWIQKCPLHTCLISFTVSCFCP